MDVNRELETGQKAGRDAAEEKPQEAEALQAKAGAEQTVLDGRGAVEDETLEQERSLREREQALALRERRADIRLALNQRGLPAELADCVREDSQEALEKSVEALEKAFTLQVQREVQERLKGEPPKSGGQAAYASQMRAALGLK